MRKESLLLIVFLVVTSILSAQTESIVQEGEIGFANIGLAHYFGDINNRSAIDYPKPALGFFARKQFGNYVALRLGGNYAVVGYADQFSKVEFQRRRNLNFESTIWEGAVQGDFNFFRFVPGDRSYPFTPYATFGIGIFKYDPYTYMAGVKYYLRELGTEGQGSAAYPERKPYKSTAICFPFGMGMKYNLFRNINLAFEIVYRYTNTDYLDDVSLTYAGNAVFSPSTPGPAYLLQDRSYVTGTRIGTAGKQRGFSSQKDHYVFAQLALSISFSSYKCADPK
jgi:hypothetical protein